MVSLVAFLSRSRRPEPRAGLRNAAGLNSLAECEVRSLSTLASTRYWSTKGERRMRSDVAMGYHNIYNSRACVTTQMSAYAVQRHLKIMLAMSDTAAKDQRARASKHSAIAIAAMCCRGSQSTFRDIIALIKCARALPLPQMRRISLPARRCAQWPIQMCRGREGC
jgi:hypothetical protein